LLSGCTQNDQNFWSKPLIWSMSLYVTFKLVIDSINILKQSLSLSKVSQLDHCL